ncbi:MAG: NAD(P)H-dependent oxidoreductase subunit E [Spirochaetales bacterium]|nr:NAD(P)H-dependent oxidoreductase subunit E [Spirochaetales bacterium]
MNEEKVTCTCGEEVPEEELFERLDVCLEEYRQKPGALIPVLQIAQGIFGYLPEHVLKYIALRLGKSYSEVAGVTGFYSFFSTNPRGKHLIRVCLGTACYVRGGKEVLDETKKLLQIDVGETTPDKMYSLEVARCFGACGLAPVMMIDADVHQRVKPARLADIIESYSKMEALTARPEVEEEAEQIRVPERLTSLQEFRVHARRIAEGNAQLGDTKRIEITMHLGSCGIASGARGVLLDMMKELQENSVNNVVLHRSGCRGLCSLEPMCTLIDEKGNEFCYGELDRRKVRRIIKEHVMQGRPVADCLVNT